MLHYLRSGGLLGGQMFMTDDDNDGGFPRFCIRFRFLLAWTDVSRVAGPRALSFRK